MRVIAWKKSENEKLSDAAGNVGRSDSHSHTQQIETSADPAVRAEALAHSSESPPPRLCQAGLPVRGREGPAGREAAARQER